MKCENDALCIEKYTQNYNYLQNVNSSLFVSPICEFRAGSHVGICACPTDYCFSHSYSWGSNTEFFYCGPCGRVGSICSPVLNCLSTISKCEQDYCQCVDDGTFYEAFYCEIPYYGYDVVLQLTIATCIVIAICFLLISTYNAFGMTRNQRLENIRDFLFRNTGTQQSPPGDQPPKYDDCVETGELPTYQEALHFEKHADTTVGVENVGFEPDPDVTGCGACADPTTCQGACSLPPESYEINDQSKSMENARNLEET